MEVGFLEDREFWFCLDFLHSSDTLTLLHSNRYGSIVQLPLPDISPSSWTVPLVDR